MPLFMDIHKNVRDTTPEDVAAAHHADVDAQGAYDVKYLRWWFNRDIGSIYCVVDAPSADVAVEVHPRAIHDELMQRCLEAHNGLRVKHTGDGLMGSFASVAKAIQCMVEMQRALAGHNEANPHPGPHETIGA